MIKRPITGRLEREGGFNLIEVLVAMGILVFGLLAVGTMHIGAVRGNYFSGNTSAALTLATERMEDLFNRNWNDPIFTDNPANNTDLSSLTNVDFEDAVTLGGTPYRRIVNFANSTGPMPMSRQMTVIVTWGDNAHSVSVSSFRTP
jgi:prepilin-type N-terminal cleavage/methylation domain-containing protein